MNLAMHNFILCPSNVLMFYCPLSDYSKVSCSDRFINIFKYHNHQKAVHTAVIVKSMYRLHCRGVENS